MDNGGRSRVLTVAAWIWVGIAAIFAIGCASDGLWLGVFGFTVSAVLAAPPVAARTADRFPAIWRRSISTIAALAAFVVLGDSVPTSATPEGKASQAASKSAPQPKPSEAAASKAETSPQQDRVITFIRHVVMQNVVCASAMDDTQRQIDRMAAERARPIDAYQEAKRGIKTCSDALSEYARSDVFDGVPKGDLNIAKGAVASCEKAARSRKSALETAQKVLDGEDRLAVVSNYLEFRDSAKTHDAACRMSLLDVAKRSSIRDSDVEFARP